MSAPVRFLSAILGALACLASPGHGAWAAGQSAASQKPPRLVVMGWDGADWGVIDPLLARGELPNLARLIARGIRAPLPTEQPMLSPILWTTIATGVGPEKHGILDFFGPARDGSGTRAVTSDMRGAPAIWNLLSDAGITVGVTAWWATFPAEKIRGFVISDRVAFQFREEKQAPDSGGLVHPDSSLADVKACYVAPERLTPSQIGRYLGPKPAGKTPSLTYLEEFPRLEEQLRRIVASSLTYRAAAAALSRKIRPDVELFYFEATDTAAHVAMRYRAPLREGVDKELAARFGGAVDAAYRDADAALGELLARSGPDPNVIVLSDHGFKSGADRPPWAAAGLEPGRATEWHGEEGILAMAGPAFTKGTPAGIALKATLFDIAPTILSLEHVPIRASLPGRALSEVLVRAPAPAQ